MSTLKAEFSWKKLALNCENLSQFTTSQWIKWPWVFLIYRWLVVLYWIIGLVLAYRQDSEIYTITDAMGPAAHKKSWSNFTFWSIAVLEADFLLAAVICFVPSCVRGCSKKRLNIDEERGRDGNGPEAEQLSLEVFNGSNLTEENPERISNMHLPWYCQLSWLLTNVNSSIGVLISTIYFGILHDQTRTIGAFDLHIHGLTTVFIVVDNLVSARPRRLLHFVYPLGFGVMYFIFSAIFWSLDKNNNVNYRVILDWNVPGRTFGCCLGFALFIVVTHTAFFFLYKLKLCIHAKVCK